MSIMDRLTDLDDKMRERLEDRARRKRESAPGYKPPRYRTPSQKVEDSWYRKREADRAARKGRQPRQPRQQRPTRGRGGRSR